MMYVSGNSQITTFVSVKLLLCMFFSLLLVFFIQFIFNINLILLCHPLLQEYLLRNVMGTVKALYYSSTSAKHHLIFMHIHASIILQEVEIRRQWQFSTWHENGSHHSSSWPAASAVML